jgi:hypothetical protein
MLINFTQKAIQELEIKKLLIDRAAPEVASESEEHIWYCTDLEIYTDASAILVVHMQTWFSFPIICKNYKGAQVEALIRDSLLKTLMAYEVPASQIDRFMKASQAMHLVKGDNNRRLLGVINAMKSSIQAQAGDNHDRGVRDDWFEIMLHVNSMPCGGPNFIFPEEEFINVYGGRMIGMEQHRKRLKDISART